MPFLNTKKKKGKNHKHQVTLINFDGSFNDLLQLNITAVLQCLGENDVQWLGLI